MTRILSYLSLVPANILNQGLTQLLNTEVAGVDVVPDTALGDHRHDHDVVVSGVRGVSNGDGKPAHPSAATNEEIKTAVGVDKLHLQAMLVLP